MSTIHSKYYKVRNFNYNGFCGRTLEGFAPYTATFTK